MVAFFECYSSEQFLLLLSSLKTNNEFVQTKTAQINSFDNKEDKIVQFETGQFEDTKNFPKILSLINWTNHVEILNKCKLIEEKLFYIISEKSGKLFIITLKH